MTAYLIDEHSSDQYTVTEPVCKIGSNPNNNVVLQFEDVEPNHVRIELKNGVYFCALEPGARAKKKYMFLFDIATAKHNNVPLVGRGIKMADGDKLQVGSRILNFRNV